MYFVFSLVPTVCVTAIKLSLGISPMGVDRVFCAPSPQPNPPRADRALIRLRNALGGIKTGVRALKSAV